MRLTEQQLAKRLIAAKPCGCEQKLTIPDPNAWALPRPLKPPTETAKKLNALVELLPRDEFVAVTFLYIDQLTPERLAKLTGTSPQVILLWERKAVERLGVFLGAVDKRVRQWLAWWGKQKLNGC